MESFKVSKQVAKFADLSLDFVAQAETKHERHQRRLVALGAILAASVLVAATVIELLRHRTH
jgi:hypothetical protein